MPGCHDWSVFAAEICRVDFSMVATSVDIFVHTQMYKRISVLLCLRFKAKTWCISGARVCVCVCVSDNGAAKKENPAASAP